MLVFSCEGSFISRFGSCLADTDAAFLQDFCLGPRGSMNGASLNDQCERVAAGSTVCGDIVSVKANIQYCLHVSTFTQFLNVHNSYTCYIYLLVNIPHLLGEMILLYSSKTSFID